MKHYLIVSAVCLMVIGLLPRTAEATPAFARQTKFPCQTCHAPYPELNEFGRTFKEQGYRLSFETDPAGPWGFPDYVPFAVQANVGATGEAGDAGNTGISVDALQLFMGGPIAPRTSAYIHHHLIMADMPGPLHEAQLRVDQPGDLPFMVRMGKFEPWLAKSPGKTVLSHFGYNPLNVQVGGNKSVLSSSKFGVGSLVFPTDNIRTDVEFYWSESGPEGFLRPFYRFLGGEAGVFVNGGDRKIGEGDEQFHDAFYRAGVDFALFPTSWLQTAGAFVYADHNSPSGLEEGARYGSGYLEGQASLGDYFTGLLRYEHIKFYQLAPAFEEAEIEAADAAMEGSDMNMATFRPMHGGEGAVEAGPDAPTLRQWLVVSLQGYLNQNTKLIGEFRQDVQDFDDSQFFVGTHFAF